MTNQNDAGQGEATTRKLTTFKFRSLGNALSFRFRCKSPMRVVLGDDDTFWVMMPAEAAWLERRGHEMVA